jgi:hypothetical protein
VADGNSFDPNGPITIILTGAVSLLVEYFRRKMPPERKDRRKDDVKDDTNSLNSPGYQNEEELEDDDV